MLLVLDVPTATPFERRQAATAAIAVIEAAAALGMNEIGSLPPLYRSGVVYAEDPPGPQAILRPAQVFEKKRADCKSLIVYRLCELRARGVRCEPRIIWLRHGVKNGRGMRAHAVIRREDGTEECPSTLLGMKG